MWSDWGLSFGEGANFYFSSGIKTFFGKRFCEFCEQLDIIQPSIHMTRRFVIQGCPTLTKTLPASEQRLEMYCQAQERDEVCTQLREYCKMGENS